MKYTDEHELKAHKTGRSHKRAVRFARKGSRSVLTYLALSISSPACPPFASDDVNAAMDEKEKRDIAWLCEGQDPEMLDIIYELRQSNHDQGLYHRWDSFLAAVALGYDAMVMHEKGARGYHSHPHPAYHEIDDEREWLDSVFYGYDLAEFAFDDDIGAIPDIMDL